MIRFLKRHVWPWAAIADAEFRAERARKMVVQSVNESLDRNYEALCLKQENDILRQRLAKYERPRDENGRFTSNG